MLHRIALVKIHEHVQESWLTRFKRLCHKADMSKSTDKERGRRFQMWPLGGAGSSLIWEAQRKPHGCPESTVGE